MSPKTLIRLSALLLVTTIGYVSCRTFIGPEIVKAHLGSTLLPSCKSKGKETAKMVCIMDMENKFTYTLNSKKCWRDVDKNKWNQAWCHKGACKTTKDKCHKPPGTVKPRLVVHDEQGGDMLKLSAKKPTSQRPKLSLWKPDDLVE